MNQVHGVEAPVGWEWCSDDVLALLGVVAGVGLRSKAGPSLHVTLERLPSLTNPSGWWDELRIHDDASAMGPISMPAPRAVFEALCAALDLTPSQREAIVALEKCERTGMELWERLGDELPALANAGVYVEVREWCYRLTPRGRQYAEALRPVR